MALDPRIDDLFLRLDQLESKVQEMEDREKRFLQLLLRAVRSIEEMAKEAS